MAGKQPNYEIIVHELQTKLLQASTQTNQEVQQSFVAYTFKWIHDHYTQKHVNHKQYLALIDRLATFKDGRYNDYLDTLAGAAALGMLDAAIQGGAMGISQFTAEASRQRRDAVTDLTGTAPKDPMMEQYTQALRKNMASAERDYENSPADKQGFVIGVIGSLWTTYHDKRQITEDQFDPLIALLCGFSNGAYREFIQSLVADYKGGHPPTIIGY